LRRTGTQAPDHAEVDHHDAVARQVEHVAGMRVGLEEAVDEDHLQDRVRAAGGEELAVEAARSTAAGSVPGMPSTCAWTFSVFAGPLAVHLGDHDVRVVLERLGDALDAARLDGEVELALEGARELLRDLRRTIPARLRNLGIDQRGHVHEDAQVRLDLRADAGPANLEHDRRAVLQARAMHLRDRCRALGARIQVTEDLEGRAAQRALELRDQSLEGNRRHVRCAASRAPRSSRRERGPRAWP
jgi:hypothetical protein